jgi:ribosomal silencing factor RsfS
MIYMTAAMAANVTLIALELDNKSVVVLHDRQRGWAVIDMNTSMVWVFGSDSIRREIMSMDRTWLNIALGEKGAPITGDALIEAPS